MRVSYVSYLRVCKLQSFPKTKNVSTFQIDAIADYFFLEL